VHRRHIFKTFLDYTIAGRLPQSTMLNRHRGPDDDIASQRFIYGDPALGAGGPAPGCRSGKWDAGLPLQSRPLLEDAPGGGGPSAHGNDTKPGEVVQHIRALSSPGANSFRTLENSNLLSSLL